MNPSPLVTPPLANPSLANPPLVNPPLVNPDEQNVIGFSESPGRRLRVQRQSRGIEIERIATQLHLRVAAVEALEQDRYQDLPGPVFVAGYLRNYARLVGLDPQPLISAFRAGHPDPQPEALPVGPMPRQELGSSHILVRLISLALLAAAVVTLALWWQNRAEILAVESPPESAAARPLLPSESTPMLPAAAAIPGANQAALAAMAAPPPLPSGTSALPLPPAPPGESLSTSAPVSAPLSAPLSASTPGAEPPAAPPVDPQQVALAFSGNTWINVRDASGTSVLSGDMRPGETRVLGGRPPYSFVIGKAAAATMTVGGKPYEPKARIQGGVARFKLDPSKTQ